MERKNRQVKVREPGKWVAPALCIAGSLVLYLVLTFTAKPPGPVSPDGMIIREPYGGKEGRYELLVEGLEAEEIPIMVEVEPRVYTEKKAEMVFYSIMDEMEERIRGSNPSLTEVTSDLDLPTAIAGTGVRLRWHSSEPDYINASGKLGNAVEKPMDVLLAVQCSDGMHKAEFEMQIRLVPPHRTEQEASLEGLKKEIAGREAAQRTEESVALPLEYEGKTLRYRTRESNSYSAILLLGVVLALLLTAREQSGKKEQEKRREQELLLDYAELVSKLMVLIGAGMTIRNAWERMVRDYEENRRRRKQKPRAAYEEMKLACFQMDNKTPEGTVYREFGRRCRLQPYLKLSSLLEQNRRTGTKNLRAILQTEMEDAFELRKNLARRMGEEAGTKLLLPLFLLLGIVMVMIMVPAMMTMG